LADDRGLRTRLAPLAAATRVWRDFFTTPTQVYREDYKFIRSGWDKA
jgi:D-psicose/D-tagatose/L-ribulose 3-epimerase